MKFAREMVKRLAVNYDTKYLHLHLSPEAQVTYIPSWRDRLVERLREFGVPAEPIEVTGQVRFSSHFFDPHGSFQARLIYPKTSASLELEISRGMTAWQVTAINLVWNPPPKEQGF